MSIHKDDGNIFEQFFSLGSGRRKQNKKIYKLWINKIEFKKAMKRYMHASLPYTWFATKKFQKC